MTMSRVLFRVALAAIPLLAACGGVGRDASHGSGTVRVDTLADGVVRVSNPRRGLWTPERTWRLTEELRIGGSESDPHYAFGRVSAVAADRAGRIYVLDRITCLLEAFDAEGRFLWAVGGKGEGPGEFEVPLGLASRTDGVLWVIDRGTRRYTAVDSTGTILDTRPRTFLGPYIQWRGGFDTQGRLVDQGGVYESPTHSSDGLIRTDTALAPVDRVLLSRAPQPSLTPVRGGRMTLSYPVPFTPRTEWAADPRGGLWRTLTDRYRIAHTTFAWDTTLIIARDMDLLPVSEEDLAEATEELAEFTSRGGRLDRSLIPDEKGPVRWLEGVPDGSLWVRVYPYESGMGPYPYDVFDADGRFLGTVESPVDLEPGLVFEGDLVYGVTLDELDVPRVLRLRIERPGLSSP